MLFYGFFLISYQKVQLSLLYSDAHMIIFIRKHEFKSPAENFSASIFNGTFYFYKVSYAKAGIVVFSE